MKENLVQSQELKQQQRLTPLQMQLVRMLEMSGPEIESEVREQLDALPALEVAENESSQQRDEDDTRHDSDEEDDSDFSGDDEIPTYRLNARNHSADDSYYSPTAVNEEDTLAEHLRNQIAALDLQPLERAIAEYIIGNIDENGYLNRNAQGISDDILFDLNRDIPAKDIEAVIDVIRGLDPAGIGAIDLKDCMLLQLRRMQPTDDVKLAEQIVEECFDQLAYKHYDKITKRLKATPEETRRALRIISRLNPKPGSQFGGTSLENKSLHIVPEFLVEPEDGRLVVTLLNNIPELTISQSFVDDTLPADTPGRDKNAAQVFIRSMRDEAQAFIKTLQMRQSTLFNVMSAIVRLQSEFFFTGDETKLKPMILKDVAAITGYDISVISRATASKYVMTVAGVLPLKFFFNDRQKDDDSTFHMIAHAMREIIDAEDKDHPLSDKDITEMLRRQGFDIARRTVAKYRERLGFPVSRLRREI